MYVVVLFLKEKKVKKTQKETKALIEIKEEVSIPGTDITLEVGDTIKVLKEYDSTDSLAEEIRPIAIDYMEYNVLSKMETKKDLNIAIQKVIRLL